MRKRSDGFQPFSDYFESRQEAATNMAETPPPSDPGESDALLQTARSSKRLGTSINCSPIAPCSEMSVVEDITWRSVMDTAKSERRRPETDSAPLHEKLRELLDENSRSFDQLRRRKSVEPLTEKLKNIARREEDPSSSISFRRGSSRLSRGPEPASAPPPPAARSPANVFEASDPPKQTSEEPEPIVEAANPPSQAFQEAAPPAQSQLPKKRGRKPRQSSSSTRPAKLPQSNSPEDGKKTVKTKAKPRSRGSKFSTKSSMFAGPFEVEPELKGVTLPAEEAPRGRYARRRRYAPLLDFLFENVTRNPDGDIQLQLADLKVRPARLPPKPSKSPTIDVEGIAVETLEETDEKVTYRLQLNAGQAKSPAVAELPLSLQVGGRGRKLLMVSTGANARRLLRTACDGGQTLRVPAGSIYGLENPGDRPVKVTLTVFRAGE